MLKLTGPHFDSVEATASLLSSRKGDGRSLPGLLSPESQMCKTMHFWIRRKLAAMPTYPKPPSDLTACTRNHTRKRATTQKPAVKQSNKNDSNKITSCWKGRHPLTSEFRTGVNSRLILLVAKQVWRSVKWFEVRPRQSACRSNPAPAISGIVATFGVKMHIACNQRLVKNWLHHGLAKLAHTTSNSLSLSSPRPHFLGKSFEPSMQWFVWTNSGCEKPWDILRPCRPCSRTYLDNYVLPAVMSFMSFVPRRLTNDAIWGQTFSSSTKGGIMEL